MSVANSARSRLLPTGACVAPKPALQLWRCRHAVLRATTPQNTSRRHERNVCASPHLALWHVAGVAARAVEAARGVMPAQRIDDVLVEEVMNPSPVVLLADMSIREAVHKLLDANVSGAPVVDSEGRLVGVLTEADLVWKGAGAPEEHYVIPPVFIGFADAYVYLRDNKKVESELSKILARTVGEAMSRRGSGRGAGGELLSVSPDAPMSHAAHVMLHHDVSMLPVVEGGDVERVVGVVTQHDILRGLYASSSPFL